MEDRRVRTLRLSPAYEDDEDYIFDEEDSPSDDDNVAAVCGRVHVMIPGKLRFVLMEDEAQTKELILERRDLFFFSTNVCAITVGYCAPYLSLEVFSIRRCDHPAMDKVLQAFTCGAI